MDESGSDRGPVNALSKALAKDLGRYQAAIDDMHLVDFKVRITQGGTEAVTRVIIDSEDGRGRRWSTVGCRPTSSMPVSRRCWTRSAGSWFVMPGDFSAKNHASGGSIFKKKMGRGS